MIQIKKKRGLNPLLVGAVVTAGVVGGAVVTVLSDKKNRKKVVAKANEVKNDVEKVVEKTLRSAKIAIADMQNSAKGKRTTLKIAPVKKSKTSSPKRTK